MPPKNFQLCAKDVRLITPKKLMWWTKTIWKYYLLGHYSVIWNTVDKIARKSVPPCWCRKLPYSPWYALSRACDFSTCFCERAQGAHGRQEKRQLHKNKFSWNYDIISINDRVQDVCAIFLHRNNWKHLRQQHQFYSIIVVE